MDLCASASHQNKDISKDTNKSLSVSMSKLRFDSNIGFSEGQIGIINLISDDYTQNQLAFSWNTIHKQNFYSIIRLRFGNPVETQTALNYGIDCNISRIVNNRKFSIEAKSDQVFFAFSFNSAKSFIEFPPNLFLAEFQ